MDLTYGARLRLQRERKNVSLATIAEVTKIKMSLLEGLERDDLSHWPAGIFRRSYVRAYAQFIGLDPDACVREFLERHPDPDEEIGAVAEARGVADGNSRAPATRLRYLIDSAVGALPALRLQSMGRSVPAGDQSHADAEAAAPADAPIDGRFRDVDLFDTGQPAAGRRDEAELPPAPAATAPDPLAPRQRSVDFLALGGLCTRLGRAVDARDVAPVLEEAVEILDAVGAILWVWDPRAGALAAVLSHGYTDELIAQLPRVPADTDNAIAAAFRASDARIVQGNEIETGAVVVPLLTPAGCAGVLAIELRQGGERREPVRAAATILAAQLAGLIGSPALARAIGA